jgi:hypothetical protein
LLEAVIARAHACVAAHGIRVSGGAVFPRQPGQASSADGELIVGRGPPAFVAFYTDARKAQRLEPGVIRSARRFHGQVQRRGAVTVIWIAPPSNALRDAVESCVWG